MSERIEKLRKSCQTALSTLGEINLSADDHRRKVFSKISVTLPKIIERLWEVDEVNTANSTINQIENIIRDLQRDLGSVNETHNIVNFDSAFNDIADRLLSYLPFLATPDLKIKQTELDELNRLLREGQNLNEYLKNEINIVQSELENAKATSITFKDLANAETGNILNQKFLERSTAEKDASDRWKYATIYLAIFVFLIIIGSFIYQYNFPVENYNPQFYQFLSNKIFLVVTSGLLAKWTSKRSSYHLTESHKYHRLALNIGTLHAFIEPLEQSDKNKVIGDIATKIFTETETSDAKAELDSANVADMVKNLLSK